MCIYPCCSVINGIQNSEVRNLFNPENVFLSDHGGGAGGHCLVGTGVPPCTGVPGGHWALVCLAGGLVGTGVPGGHWALVDAQWCAALHCYLLAVHVDVVRGADAESRRRRC